MEVLCKVVLPTDTGLPRDEMDNSWVAFIPSVTVETFDPESVGVVFAAAYNTVGNDFWGPQIDSGVDRCRVEFSDITAHLDGSAHGPAFATYLWQKEAPDTDPSPLPEQVAIVATLYAEGRAAAPVELAGTHPKARRTGHVFVGPWSSNAVEVVAGHTVVKADLREQLAFMVQSIAGGLATGPDAGVLEVWSRADAATRPVVGGHVDDRFDIQRRRAPTSLARTIFAV